MNILIVDDEPLARLRLRQLLAEIEGIGSIWEASNAAHAFELAREHDPDLFLLDIEMPGLDGIAFARSSSDLPPIIFTTAHSRHAADAFEVDAVDYLLKPIKRERLETAIEKARSRTDPRLLKRLNALLDALRAARRSASTTVRLGAHRGGSYELFDAVEVTRFQATDKCVVCCWEGRELVLDQSLSELEDKLVPHDFMRVHRSELVNLRKVRRVTIDGRSCSLELTDGQIVSVSRRVLPELRLRLGISEG